MSRRNYTNYNNFCPQKTITEEIILIIITEVSLLFYLSRIRELENFFFYLNYWEFEKKWQAISVRMVQSLATDNS